MASAVLPRAALPLRGALRGMVDRFATRAGIDAGAGACVRRAAPPVARRLAAAAPSRTERWPAGGLRCGAAVSARRGLGESNIYTKPPDSDRDS